MNDALQALAEPKRRRILTLIRDRELAVGEIAAQFDVTRPAISQHLRVLKEAGLVTDRQEGTRRYYRAVPEGLAELRAFVEGFWDLRLEALKDAAEAEERQNRRAGNEKRKQR